MKLAEESVLYKPSAMYDMCIVLTQVYALDPEWHLI